MAQEFLLLFDEERVVDCGGAERRVLLDLADVVSRLLTVGKNLQIQHVYPPKSVGRVEIRLKSWATLNGVYHALGKHRAHLHEILEKSFCVFCFQETAETSHYTDAASCLFHDRHGEELHHLFFVCKQHCPPSTAIIMQTFQVENLTPEEPVCWEKIATWRMRGRYYSQRIWQYYDGEYETGYYLSSGASPWLGPYTTREEARARAVARETW